MIRFPVGLTKEGKKKNVPVDSQQRKNIPINHHVRKALSELPRALHSDYVFTYRGKQIKGNTYAAFARACSKAGILHGREIEGGLTFHDLRTTFKTNMLRAGVDKVYRDLIVGHTLKGMDGRYLKPSDEDLRKVMEKYTAWVDAQLQNVTQTVTQKTN